MDERISAIWTTRHQRDAQAVVTWVGSEDDDAGQVVHDAIGNPQDTESIIVRCERGWYRGPAEEMFTTSLWQSPQQFLIPT